MLRKLRISDQVIYKDCHRSMEGKIVAIFKAFVIPKKKKVLKYYGCEIINPRYDRVFGLLAVDRIVIKVKGKKKKYIICPMSLRASFELEKTYIKEL